MSYRDRVKRALQPARMVEVLATSCDEIMSGKTVLVTGGTSGIGRSALELLLRSGAKVAFTGRPGNPAVAELEALLGDDAFGFEYDANSQSATDLLESVCGRLGYMPDCLFANAGVYTDGDSAWREDPVERVIRINLLATANLVNSIVEGWVAEKTKGTIVVTGSNRGLMPDAQPYGIAKAALHSFVQGVARKHYKDGIRANVVAPGMTATGINGIEPNGDLRMELQLVGDARVIRPEEVAEVVLFLLSDKSICVNGAVVPCDLGDYLR